MSRYIKFRNTPGVDQKQSKTPSKPPIKIFPSKWFNWTLLKGPILILFIFIVSTANSANTTAPHYPIVIGNYRARTHLLNLVGEDPTSTNFVRRSVGTKFESPATGSISPDVTLRERNQTRKNVKSWVDDLMTTLKMDVNPCDDFYQYACADWMDKNPVPRDQIKWTPMDKLRKDNEFSIKVALEQREKGRGEAEEKAKRFYRSCMDGQKAREKLGVKPLQKLIEKIGGWSLGPSGFDPVNWNFQKTLQILHNRYDTPCFFSVVVDKDPRNSTRNVLQIGYGAPIGFVAQVQSKYSEYRRVDQEKPNFAINTLTVDYMTKVAMLLGATSRNETYQLMRKTLLLEDDLQLFASQKDNDEDDETRSTNMTLADLKILSPVIYWDVYLNAAVECVNGSVSDDDIIVVRNPKALATLSSLIDKLLKVDGGNLLLNNYMVWLLVDKMVPHLSKEFLALQQDLLKATRMPPGNEKWRNCVSATNDALGFAVSAIHTRESSNNVERLIARGILKNLQRAFKSNLKTIGWMTNRTRDAAKDKMDAMTDHVGYPEFIVESNKVDRYYSTLDIVGGDHFGNVLRASQFSRTKKVEKFGQAVEDEWKVKPSSTNSFYDLTRNLIAVTAGALRSPFFYPNSHSSINYGKIGSILAHELTHGFDFTGGQYDKVGNLAGWWDVETIQNFKRETRCMVNQYSRLGVDGNKTLEENMAENVGIKTAFNAYRLIEKNGSKKISKSQMTPDQIFFISTAQAWCMNVNSKYIMRPTKLDVTYPEVARGLVPLQNFPEFSRAFNCSRGSFMNPSRKCAHW